MRAAVKIFMSIFGSNNQAMSDDALIELAFSSVKTLHSSTTSYASMELDRIQVQADSIISRGGRRKGSRRD